MVRPAGKAIVDIKIPFLSVYLHFKQAQKNQSSFFP